MLQAIISYYYELCDKDDGMAIKIFDDETQIGKLPFNLLTFLLSFDTPASEIILVSHDPGNVPLSLIPVVVRVAQD